MKPSGVKGGSDWFHIWTIRNGKVASCRSLNDTALLRKPGGGEFVSRTRCSALAVHRRMRTPVASKSRNRDPGSASHHFMPRRARHEEISKTV